MCAIRFLFILRAVLLCLVCLWWGCDSGDGLARPILKVGTSGDYAPFSSDQSGELVGFDIALAQQFATDHEMALEFVIFKWPSLLADLKAGKFDVAMSGVTVRLDRSLAARFTVPTTKSGAVVIVPSVAFEETFETLDREGIRIGVNEGGHLERVTREQFRSASIVTSSENQAVPDMLLAGTIDALVTDTMEAPFWLQRLPGAKALAPFTQDRKAWLVHQDKSELADQLDEWLQEQESNGNLGKLRKAFLPEGNDDETALPLAALLAAMDERLSLMIAVAESKRILGKSVEDLAQEARVLEAAVQGVTEAARSQGREPLDTAAVRGFFKAQIEAAKAIQYKTLEGAATMSDPPDLVNELRPALGRISERINRLLLAAKIESGERINSLVSQAFAQHQLAENHLVSISESLKMVLHDDQ